MTRVNGAFSGLVWQRFLIKSDFSYKKDSKVEMTLEQVQALVAVAIEQASNRFKRPISVAVCDTRGLLLSFTRMPGATLRSVVMSQDKAYTAAYMVMDSDAFAERLKREDVPVSFFCDGRLTGLAGGVVLRDVAGEFVGAAGVSGLTPQEDKAIAEMMAARSRQP